MKDNIGLIKSKKFALRIIHLYRYLVDTKKEFVLSNQLLRSGTSIGANLAEAECAMTKKDFILKVYIALKECAETQYWLDLLYESVIITEKEYKSIYADCNELTRILTATTKTMKNRSSNN